MAKKKYHGGKMSGGGNHANMPTDVKMTAYPKGSYGIGEGYGDTIESIDSKAKNNHSKIMKKFNPHNRG